ncbi:MAG: hypothetical protein P1U83_14030 [Roseovarius sp.]|nr:hypothetical protein [Roseovarius sp.]
MSLHDPVFWLLLPLLFYGLICGSWARTAAQANQRPSDFFTAGKTLAPWMTALALSGVSISGWIALGFPQSIASQGFGFAVLGLSGILIPLTGVLFLKPQWAIAKRHGYTSQGEMLNAYFGGHAIGVIAALIAVLIAVAFSGIQLRSVAKLLASLSGNESLFPYFVWGIAFVVAGYLIIGGMRAAGFLSVLQTVLLGLALILLGAFVLFLQGGFEPINQQLAEIAQQPSSVSKGLFEVAGVIQFTAGLGIEAPIGGQWTAVMIFSTSLALMGIQASPMATQLVLSTRNPKGIAAGQTWVFASFFGALIVGCVVLVGAVGIGKDNHWLATVMATIADTSPWFMSLIALGILAVVQLVMGFSALTAAHALVQDVYKPYFHKGISQKDQLLFSRVVIGLVLLVSALLALLGPFVVSALSSVALPSALQLWPALLGLCWFRFITRQSVLAGALIGIFAVFVTDTAGIGILAFLGLDLPWGRWPWTIHSAGWGLFFNLLAVLVISAITQGRGHAKIAGDVRRLLRSYMKPKSTNRALKPAAWSAALAWFFLAVGPGVVLGNTAFGPPTEGYDSWVVGLPSIWAWTIAFWVLGIFLVWFLSYKMELASASSVEITPLEPVLSVAPRDTKIQKQEMLRLGWTISAIAALTTITTWIFG